MGLGHSDLKSECPSPISDSPLKVVAIARAISITEDCTIYTLQSQCLITCTAGELGSV